MKKWKFLNFVTWFKVIVTRVYNNIMWNILALWFMIQIPRRLICLFCFLFCFVFLLWLFFPCWFLKLSLMLNSCFYLDNELCIHDSWLRFICFCFFFLFVCFCFINMFLFLLFLVLKKSLLKKTLSITAKCNYKT